MILALLRRRVMLMGGRGRRFAGRRAALLLGGEAQVQHDDREARAEDAMSAHDDRLRRKLGQR